MNQIHMVNKHIKTCKEFHTHKNMHAYPSIAVNKLQQVKISIKW